MGAPGPNFFSCLGIAWRRNWEKWIYSFIASSLWKGLALLPLVAIIFSYIPSFIQQLNFPRVGSESSKRERLIDLLKSYILCVIANLLFSGLIIVIKVSIEKGCSRYVLLSYGQAFGALTTGVLALLYERFPSIFSLLLLALSYYLGTNLLLLHFLFPYKIFSCLSVYLGGQGWIPNVSVENTNSNWKYRMMPIQLQDS